MITTFAIYLWVLGPGVLFVVLAGYLLRAGWTMRSTIFRAPTQMPSPRRRAPLINVVTRKAGPAGELYPSRFRG